MIETRKDQIEALDWQIRPRRGGPSDDPRISVIEDLLRTPDRERPWGTWVRLLLEDLFVLDAPTLYVRRTATGALWGLEVVDGATIKRLLGPDGRTPRAPGPAYQKVTVTVHSNSYWAVSNLKRNSLFGLKNCLQVFVVGFVRGSAPIFRATSKSDASATKRQRQNGIVISYNSLPERFCARASLAIAEIGPFRDARR